MFNLLKQEYNGIGKKEKKSKDRKAQKKKKKKTRSSQEKEINNFIFNLKNFYVEISYKI